MTASHRGLIVDFGGVVTTDFYAALRAFGVREGLGANAVEHILRDTDEGRSALAGVEDGSLPQREYERILARLLGVDSTGLLGRMLADLEPCPPVLDLIGRARAAGIATAVLSNSWGTGEYDPYDGYDLEERFDAVVISDQVGLRKPDPQIYLLAAEKIGTDARECVFVDDTAHNLPPAEKLGMATVHFSDVSTGIAKIEKLLRLG
ncbi:HAD family hydrolase [Actinomadura rayongensis]|uniref:HAD-IA family hydrolase n=1 Tax=Actinomadura rayongensis TaxID=1429076 RepID=A0A6I4WCX8_9ACTN|nr:HAD family phosphatase [Actinomadura rayongensis]MXQ66983.1 HAD-IA family hydrolase [Actinomadura rayongensis]